ncbi:MAG: hypothetical protein O7I42_03890 [Alphaproteobacteria bacterium]|nr:hypothetical protein [Alphaproteobacteria bacterium]
MSSFGDLKERAEKLAEQFCETQSERRVTILEHTLGDLRDAVQRDVDVIESLKSENTALVRENEHLTQVLNSLVSAIEQSRVMDVFHDLCEQFENLKLSLNGSRVSEMESETDANSRLMRISDSEGNIAEGPNETMAFDTYKTFETPVVEVSAEMRRALGNNSA